MNARVTLYEGANILFPEGPRIVIAVGPFGYTVRDVTGGVHEVSWTDVEPARASVDGRVDAVAESLMAVLSGLSDDALQESLDKLEVVLTMRTGFALGHPALARPGEPYSLFNPARTVSDSKKCEAMAKILAREALLDRRRQRNLEAGKASPRARVGAVSQRQLMNWLADFDRPINGGLLALVDKRRVRRHSAFGGLDPEVRRVADDIAARIDGPSGVDPAGLPDAGCSSRRAHNSFPHDEEASRCPGLDRLPRPSAGPSRRDRRDSQRHVLRRPVDW